MSFLYEPHLHTRPASRCARHSVETALHFYKEHGFDGVFITNHFLNGNTGADSTLSRAEQLDFFCRDYFEALALARKIGIQVFFGAEITDLHAGSMTDFLIYGPSPEWYCEHPELLDLPVEHALDLLHLNGALIVHAHPFREGYGQEIRLLPRKVDAVETVNAHNHRSENKMALKYARHYRLRCFAGSDNHNVATQSRLCGIATRTRICSAEDLITLVRKGQYRLFQKRLPKESPNPKMPPEKTTSAEKSGGQKAEKAETELQ